MPRNLVLPGKPGTHTFPPLLVGEGWGEGTNAHLFLRLAGLRSGTHGGEWGAATTHTPPTNEPLSLTKTQCRGVSRGRPWGAGHGKNHPSLAPHRHPNLSSRASTLVIPNPFAVIPSEAEGPETAADNNTTVQEPTRPPSCRETRYPPNSVFPDSDRGPRGAATSRTPTTHPQPRGTTTTTVVPGKPGTHGGARASGADSPSIPIPRCHPEPFYCHPERSRGT